MHVKPKKNNGPLEMGSLSFESAIGLLALLVFIFGLLAASIILGVTILAVCHFLATWTGKKPWDWKELGEAFLGGNVSRCSEVVPSVGKLGFSAVVVFWHVPGEALAGRVSFQACATMFRPSPTLTKGTIRTYSNPKPRLNPP